MNELKIIRQLPKRDLYEALAEESAELSQAALKCIRAEKLNKNVTPKTEQEALDNLKEELLDVAVCAFIMGIPLPNEKDILSNFKLNRWASRLEKEFKTGGE